MIAKDTGSSRLAPLVAQLLTSLLAVALVIAGAILHLCLSKDHHSELYQSLFQIMENIARGNFNVRVDERMKHPPRWGGLYRRIDDMVAGLQQLEEMRQVFISNVSHEIQSPLTSVRGFVQALRSDTLTTEERDHYLNIIETESRRLSALTDNLLHNSIKFTPPGGIA